MKKYKYLIFFTKVVYMCILYIHYYYGKGETSLVWKDYQESNKIKRLKWHKDNDTRERERERENFDIEFPSGAAVPKRMKLFYYFAVQ